ncbi:hypothetical protein NNL21_12825 [Paenibacillus mendelii]|uniref:Spore germination protein N-terminal domain-containing protein n=1 Tax=Paenibacillus mendelii TaxID=206163 RepID=A0ABV6J8M1_9BACL|nr:hypothetical protein [Paenibacillus mendelii]MCQ6559578.1 hypothetical protein [Paenibacillus mendelii]
MSQSPTTMVISAAGADIAAAAASLQEKVPRRLFWGQNEVFVIGHEVAMKDDCLPAG